MERRNGCMKSDNRPVQSTAPFCLLPFRRALLCHETITRLLPGDQANMRRYGAGTACVATACLGVFRYMPSSTVGRSASRAGRGAASRVESRLCTAIHYASRRRKQASLHLLLDPPPPPFISPLGAGWAELCLQDADARMYPRIHAGALQQHWENSPCEVGRISEVGMAGYSTRAVWSSVTANGSDSHGGRLERGRKRWVLAAVDRHQQGSRRDETLSQVTPPELVLSGATVVLLQYCTAVNAVGRHRR